MSIFGNILGKIFHQDGAKAVPANAKPASPAPAATPPARPEAPTDVQAEVSAPAPVDVGAVLEAMASMKEDRGGNYQTSIVDLLKLLDLDSSLTARKELAEELQVDAGEAGSAEQNIALHRAVMVKLEENGGVVPDSLRS